MLLTELGNEIVRAACGEDGEFGQRAPQPVDRDGADASVESRFVYGVLELLRHFKGCNENPGFEMGMTFGSLGDLAADTTFVQP